MSVCEVTWCIRKHYALRLCFAHYKRKRDNRDMDMPFQVKGQDRVRFAERVKKTEGCWEWTAGKSAAGYGTISIAGKPQLAHRLAFEWHNGTIPDGMEIDHICHNRGCVKPDHLRLANSGQNKQNLAGASRSSKSGVRGVTYYPERGKWMAKATLRGQQHYLGWFTSLAAAETVVVQWRRENMPYSTEDQKEAS